MSILLAFQAAFLLVHASLATGSVRPLPWDIAGLTSAVRSWRAASEVVGYLSEPFVRAFRLLLDVPRLASLVSGMSALWLAHAGVHVLARRFATAVLLPRAATPQGLGVWIVAMVAITGAVTALMSSLLFGIGYLVHVGLSRPAPPPRLPGFVVAMFKPRAYVGALPWAAAAVLVMAFVFAVRADATGIMASRSRRRKAFLDAADAAAVVLSRVLIVVLGLAFVIA